MFANTRAHHNIYLVSLVILVIKMVQIMPACSGMSPTESSVYKGGRPYLPEPIIFYWFNEGIKNNKRE